MSRFTRLTHQRIGRWRPRLEVLELRRVLSFVVVEVSPPTAPLPTTPPAESPGLPSGVTVDPPPPPRPRLRRAASRLTRLRPPRPHLRRKALASWASSLSTHLRGTT